METSSFSNNLNDKEKKNEFENNYSNEDNDNNKSLLKGNTNIYHFNDNSQDKNILNLNDNDNDNDNDYIDSTGRNTHLSHKFNSLSNRTNNMTNYSNKNYKTNKISNYKFTLSNYLDKGKPLDLKEITINNKSKTSSNFNDSKELYKYYRTNNMFLNTYKNNDNKIMTFSMIKEKIYDIDDISHLHKKKLKSISKKN